MNRTGVNVGTPGHCDQHVTPFTEVRFWMRRDALSVAISAALSASECHDSYQLQGALAAQLNHTKPQE